MSVQLKSAADIDKAVRQTAEMLRLRPHDADELSHYSAGTSDVEFMYPWGWGELEGIANRGNYDLTQHALHSGEKLEWYDQAAMNAVGT